MSITTRNTCMALKISMPRCMALTAPITADNAKAWLRNCAAPATLASTLETTSWGSSAGLEVSRPWALCVHTGARSSCLAQQPCGRAGGAPRGCACRHGPSNARWRMRRGNDTGVEGLGRQEGGGPPGNGAKYNAEKRSSGSSLRHVPDPGGAYWCCAGTALVIHSR